MAKPSLLPISFRSLLKCLIKVFLSIFNNPTTPILLTHHLMDYKYFNFLFLYH